MLLKRRGVVSKMTGTHPVPASAYLLSAGIVCVLDELLEDGSALRIVPQDLTDAGGEIDLGSRDGNACLASLEMSNTGDWVAIAMILGLSCY